MGTSMGVGGKGFRNMRDQTLSTNLTAQRRNREKEGKQETGTGRKCKNLDSRSDVYRGRTGCGDDLLSLAVAPIYHLQSGGSWLGTSAADRTSATYLTLPSRSVFVRARTHPTARRGTEGAALECSGAGAAARRRGGDMRFES